MDDEEQPDAADEAGALSTTPVSGGAAVEEGSRLAEDILAAPSALPSHDPVRVETAAYLTKNACYTAPRRRRGSWRWCCLTAEIM